jgi:ectoine hydroxylase-related dioxygenase (phytanoyl-CoA dioxygenase family)
MGSMSERTSLSVLLRDPDQPGFAYYPGFSDPSVCEAMLADVVGIARDAAAGQSVAPALVTPETQEGFSGRHPEDLVSKIFKLHRRPVFREPLSDPRVVQILYDAIGPDVDCFLSQFIFKNPGAWGQPWHQDSFYFPFTPARPIVGLWLAVTEATLQNGPLHILPGSQAEPVHEHVPDKRPNSPFGYVEIVDHDTNASQPCLLQAGDLLVFDSHLMHCSTDNLSKTLRAAMVWHFAAAGTVDDGTLLANGKRFHNPVNDWVPVVRDGVAV